MTNQEKAAPKAEKTTVEKGKKNNLPLILVSVLSILVIGYLLYDKLGTTTDEVTPPITQETIIDTTTQKAETITELKADNTAETTTATSLKKAVETAKLKQELAALKAAEKQKEEAAAKKAKAGNAVLTKLYSNMVLVPGGTFTMGCTSEQGDNCDDDENPSHTVNLSSYYIGKYEVTQAQWRAVMGTSPSNNSNCDDCPVEQVSYTDVNNFIRKLNAKTGKSYRLPTEAEWEFAARGGNKSKGYKYSGSNTLSSVAWYNDNSGGETHIVGTKQKNELRLYDMSGNVWEWCSDWYGKTYYSSSSYSNPTGAGSSSSHRVDRGGSWRYYARGCRVAARGSHSPSYSYYYLGFRLALRSK